MRFMPFPRSINTAVELFVGNVLFRSHRANRERLDKLSHLLETVDLLLTLSVVAHHDVQHYLMFRSKALDIAHDLYILFVVFIGQLSWSVGLCLDYSSCSIILAPSVKLIM